MDTLSIVIPTYRREKVLIDTVQALLSLPNAADEILLVDQTDEHEPEVAAQLAAWHAEKRICHLRQSQPAVTRAMNRGLIDASSDLVLFLDDDIIPDSNLVAGHREAHRQYGPELVAGRVLQPWHQGDAEIAETPFHFACTTPQWIGEFMGGNVSMRRETALALGGFDENFVRVAYNFEAEFAYRVSSAGGKIYFEPAASIHHLREVRGGTRSFSNHLKTLRPDHAVGAYYFIFRTWNGFGGMRRLLRRAFRSVATRHHLTKPWRIPMTLIAEVRGFLWASRLAMRGVRYIKPEFREPRSTRKRAEC